MLRPVPANPIITAHSSPFLPPSEQLLLHLQDPHPSHDFLLLPSVDSSALVHATYPIASSGTHAHRVLDRIPYPTVGLKDFSSNLSPVNIRLMADLLEHHPDRAVVTYVLNGLLQGFSIGFSGQLVHSSAKNLMSAYAHFQGVTLAIQTEVSRLHT